MQAKEGPRTYPVVRISDKLEITGKGTDPKWKAAKTLTDFIYPWENETVPPTRFKALHDNSNVFFLFDVTDPAVYIHKHTNNKAEVAASSRAEIFFKADDRMQPYYCLEMDPEGRVLDYEGVFHRKFDLKWSWPQGEMTIATHQRKDGYTIELAISKRSLKELGLLHGNVLQAGLFRADCKPPSGGQQEFKWISWVRPDSKTPDFHIPSAFGLLQLQD